MLDNGGRCGRTWGAQVRINGRTSSASSTAPFVRPKEVSAATRSSSCADRRRLSIGEGVQAFTRISSGFGKGFASFARLPRPALDARVRDAVGACHDGRRRPYARMLLCSAATGAKNMTLLRRSALCHIMKRESLDRRARRPLANSQSRNAVIFGTPKSPSADDPIRLGTF